MQLKDYQRRFMALPRVEQQRLANLVKYIQAGHQLNESLLRGFPQEAKEILEAMLRGRLEEEGKEVR